MAESIEKSTLWVIGGLLAGTITITATVVGVFYNEYVTPLKVIESTQKIEKLSSQLEEKSRKEVELSDELNSTKASLEYLKMTLEKLENTNLFAGSTAYPSTLDDIKVGSHISLIKKVFDEKYISGPNEAEGDFKIQVRLPNSIFSPIYYLYDEKTKKITTIVFALDYKRKFSQGFLLASLTKTLGQPSPSRKKGHFKWSNKKSPSVYIMDDDMYFVCGDGYQPALWKE